MVIFLIKFISKIIPLVISPIFLIGCNTHKTLDKSIISNKIVQSSNEDVSLTLTESIVKDECRKS